MTPTTGAARSRWWKACVTEKANGHKYYIEDREELKKDTVRNWLINSFAISNVLQESRNLKCILFEEIPSPECVRDEIRFRASDICKLYNQ